MPERTDKKELLTLRRLRESAQLAQGVHLLWLMCGYFGTTWQLSLVFLTVSAALIVAAVVFVVRQLSKPREKEGER